ncbi:MAG: hypothetical protein ACI8YI_001211 [Paracoccaceae bacterium]|jgi:hypothetical protein
MLYPDLPSFLAQGAGKLSAGPVGVLLMEDLSETNSTIRHHIGLGLSNIIVLGTDALKISPELRGKIHHVVYDLGVDDAMQDAINPLIAALPDRWFYYGYNTEYLFYPFCETRSIGEVTKFATEERRSSILTYVIDLYAEDLENHPNGVSLPAAHLDKSGYYAQARWRDGADLERQLEMFGGLRWRFEEHVDWQKRKIDRIGLFRAQKGLELRGNNTFNMEEYNTYACPWHHNLTAAICSFRAAKFLKTNPGSSEAIDAFTWHNSEKFAWHSRQLLDIGLMEPGQWI